MSEGLRKIKEFRKQVVTELYNQCTELQQGVFKQIFGNVESIADNKIDSAIQLCERTIASNAKKSDD